MRCREPWQVVLGAIQRWDDPSGLPAVVDEIDRRVRLLVRASQPLLQAVMLSESPEIPYRARVFAQRLYNSLRDTHAHVQRFLGQRSLWGERGYREFLGEIEDFAHTVTGFYHDMVPYLEAAGERLPSNQETPLLEALQPQETIVDVEFEP